MLGGGGGVRAREIEIPTSAIRDEVDLMTPFGEDTVDER